MNNRYVTIKTDIGTYYLTPSNVVSTKKQIENNPNFSKELIYLQMADVAIQDNQIVKFRYELPLDLPIASYRLR